MKKLLAVLLLISLLALGAVGASAALGSGADAVASDITLIKTGLRGKKICFTDGDFKSALCISDFDTITVTSLPSSTEGTLLLGGRRVGVGKTVKRKNIASLVFLPASESVSECSFSFTVDGYAGGAEIKCILKFIDKVNYAPSPSDEALAKTSVNTQEAICVHGRMSGEDPEGDILEYIVVSYPKRGVLDVSVSGKYVYTPMDDYTGQDRFTYVIRDEYGNYSEPVTVKITVNERMCDTEYTDMVGAREYNAAVAMSAMGIMSGKILGDDTYFMPDTEVTKAEFVAMAMKTMGIRADSTLTKSFFDDNADIPTSLVGYVATAQRAGFINGDFEDGMLVFKPNEIITRYEAAKIMASILGADGEGEESVFADEDDTPVWARSGVCAMYSMGIFTDDDGIANSDKITRAASAMYLYRMAEAK